jgi:hypothetical protein
VLCKRDQEIDISVFTESTLFATMNQVRVVVNQALDQLFPNLVCEFQLEPRDSDSNLSSASFCSSGSNDSDSPEWFPQTSNLPLTDQCHVFLSGSSPSDLSVAQMLQTNLHGSNLLLDEHDGGETTSHGNENEATRPSVPLVCFLESTDWLQGSQGWLDVFPNVLKRTLVYCPVMSQQGVATVCQSSTPSVSIGANYTLLSWLLALQLKDLGQIKQIIPIFVTESVDVATCSDVHTVTNAACVQVLRNKLGLELSTEQEKAIMSLSVGEIFNRLQAHHGICLEQLTRRQAFLTDWLMPARCAHVLNEVASSIWEVFQQRESSARKPGRTAQFAVGRIGVQTVSNEANWRPETQLVELATTRVRYDGDSYF